MATLVALLALVQSPDTTRIERLIGDLDADPIEIRTAASAALVSMGTDALPTLRQAIREARTPSVLSHLRHVVSCIELGEKWREVAGTNTVGGLRLRIGLADSGEPLRAGTPVPLMVEIRNVSEASVPLVPVRTWSVECPGYRRYYGMAQAEVIVTQVAGEAPTEWSSGGIPCSAGIHPPRVVLAPGEIRRTTTSVELGAGGHEIAVTYFTKKLDLGEQDLRSNVLKITVK